MHGTPGTAGINVQEKQQTGMIGGREEVLLVNSCPLIFKEVISINLGS